KSLLVPYVVWGGVLVLSVALLALLQNATIPFRLFASSILGGAYAGRPFSAFWFVTALFFAILCLRSLERLPRWATWLVASLGSWFAYSLPEVARSMPLSVGVLGPCILFLAFG